MTWRVHLPSRSVQCLTVCWEEHAGRRRLRWRSSEVQQISALLDRTEKEKSVISWLYSNHTNLCYNRNTYKHGKHSKHHKTNQEKQTYTLLLLTHREYIYIYRKVWFKLHISKLMSYITLKITNSIHIYILLHLL